MRRSVLLALFSVAILAMTGCSQDNVTQPESSASNLEETDSAALKGAPLQEAPTDKNFGLRRDMRAYEVIIENLTPPTGEGSSQPFSPAILATHRSPLEAISRRGYATDELAQVAEDAVNGPLVEALHASRGVAAVATGDGVILPGGQARFEVAADRGAGKLSVVFMLVNTNDAFGWLDAVELPRSGERIYLVGAYDAGSEINTELTGDIPGPCCGSPGMGPDEHEPIAMHEGILGVGDLDPATWGWEGPVARVTVRRLAPAYTVTLENLAPATVEGGSQVFSPPVLATHRGGTRIFRPGEYASDPLAALAEDGMTGGLVAVLEADPQVHDHVTGDGPVPPGASATYEIEAAMDARWLSLAAMLVNTNDGFTGGDRIPLPLGGSAAYYLPTYDAGSELNTELAGDIPGPCCGSPGMGTDEHEPIAMHDGILGVGDLAVEDYGWDDPVAKLTITRVR